MIRIAQQCLSAMLKIENNNKHKIHNFFVIARNRQALLHMLDIKTLDILTIMCNTIDTQKADRDNKCRTNTTNYQGSRHKQHYTNYTNMMQEADRPPKCLRNTDSNSKSYNKKPMVNDNENRKINYFFPGPNQNNDMSVRPEIAQEL